ncbi:hypothetical protein C6P45_003278 [Maudiozyma exigua]|uniref:Uncharacterized protein n=1 Tax=Maudiozyma exigua TaxID=34358 RepID=A0A9P6VVB9_MAUEX|nr:hypothetical protein C6P45_003278 [Kazachstania exigua]
MSSLIINLDDLDQLRQKYCINHQYGKIEPIRCEVIAQILEIEFKDLINDSFEGSYRCTMRIKNVSIMKIVSQSNSSDLEITIIVDGNVHESLYHKRGESIGKGDICQFSLVLWNPMERNEETNGIWEAVDINLLTLKDIEDTQRFLLSDLGQEFLNKQAP